MRRYAPLLVALLGIGLTAVAMVKISRDVRDAREREELRGRILAARLAADSCRGSLEWQQERLQAFRARVDSLRAEVQAFEALDPRGVPEARYAEYLERFHAYNDSVASWEGRVQALRTGEAACRALVEAHNALGDSLRRRDQAEGGGG